MLFQCLIVNNKILDHLSQRFKVIYCDWSSSAIDRASCINFFFTQSPPDPLAQVKNNFTELFQIMPSAKKAQTVLFCHTKGQPEL